jgi:hypothetical protein
MIGHACVGPLSRVPERGAIGRVLALCAGLFLSGCGDPGDRVGVELAPSDRLHSAILGGSSSEDGQNSTVMLVRIDPATNSRLAVCTAALVAPRLLLTARHCLANANPEVACESNGTPVLGGEIAGNFEPQNFYVFAGSRRAEFIGDASTTLDTTRWKPSAQGLAIIDDKSTTLCNHDLALLVLKTEVANTPLASLRLDGEARAGEGLLAVGWGVATDEVEPKQRRQRSDIAVTRVGPSEDLPILTKSEFLFGESICKGDSGGPIFSSKTGAILGVVSRGGNGNPDTGGPAATCIGANNVATKVGPFKELVMEGFKQAQAAPVLEPEEDEGCSAAPVGSHTRPAPGSGLAASALALALAVSRRRRRVAS